MDVWCIAPNALTFLLPLAVDVGPILKLRGIKVAFEV